MTTGEISVTHLAPQPLVERLFVERPAIRNWYAVRTCANHEKRVSERFDARCLEHFLPTYTRISRWKDRRVKLESPLFPGYLFVRIAPEERLRVVEVAGVAELVSFNRQPYPLANDEIESLRSGIENALRFEPHPYLNVGCRVRIKHGPLRGCEGILRRKKNVYRVVLSLHLIAQSAAVEVDAGDVERIA
jgi:transcription antitermination factor NusG